MKIIIFVLLAAIVISLGAALFHLSRDESDSKKVLKALQIRVSLPTTLIPFLVVS